MTCHSGNSQGEGRKDQASLLGLNCHVSGPTVLLSYTVSKKEAENH